MVDGSALVVPEPTAALTPERVEDVCASVEAWSARCESIPELKDAGLKLDAIGTYLARKAEVGQARVAAAQRRIEVRIGKLLGPAEVGSNQHSEGVTAVTPSQLSSRERVEFRRMAAHEDVVERHLARATDAAPPSRRAVMKEVRRTAVAAERPPAEHTATGVYPTIVIDPPWRYDNVATRGAAEDHYPTMTLDQLAALELPADDDAHLYLWTTNSFLRPAFDLVDAWGFTYKTTLTWCKPSIGMGNYWRNNTEHILFAVRGRCPTLVNNVGTWFEAPKTQHSAKPETFYDLVERASPGPWMEMFARRRRMGWDVWGNEA